ncbi:MAG: DUF3857 domain-containing protein, partial [Bacteroidota bacterium]|nr:DUF3857 domain-containing protein [Bacteroidota bacterium]
MKMLPGILLRIVACFILLSLFSPLAAQEKIKFGKIDIADLKMNRCPFDSSADAMILGDIGQTYFLYDDLHGFSMIFERLIRIKILTKKGYSDANIEIPFYHLNQDEEKITSIKARTYNLENGKIVETKVTDESIFDEEVDAYWKNRKISFPAVREGSIVELKYSISSPFLFNLRSWYFQDRLPIRWSEYEVRIPEFFKYTKNATGFLSFVVNENSTNQSHINQMSTTYKGNALTANSATYEDNSVEYTEYNTRLATKDVPAFKEEPYTSSIKNFISKIEFSYTGYQFPRQPFHSKYSTWEEIIDDLEQDGDFGSQIRKKGL